MIDFINSFNYQFYNKDIFRKFISHFTDAPIVKKRKGKYFHRYLNIPCAFDIEVSSFRDYFDEKVALMYTWQICINGIVWIGRDYKEFYSMLNDLHDVLKLGYLKKIVFYVHNLQYEFNNLRHYLDVGDYFAIDNRQPIFVSDKRGVEFRCSYLLSGYSLEYIGSDILKKYPVKKKVGDLDYSLIRTPKTPLTYKDIGYIVNDVRVVTNYIKELMDNGEDIAHIPLTKTGRVRSALIKSCVRKGNKLNNKYIDMMQTMKISGPDEYIELKEAFSGGFTHSNPYNTNKTLLRSKEKGVMPYDINSEYPWIMCTKMFPMTSGKYIPFMNLDEYKKHIKNGLMLIARCDIKNIESTFLYDYYISKSKCRDIINPVISNGRVVKADKLSITLTELDFDIIEKTYKFEDIKFYDIYKFVPDYLPIEYVNTILDFYQGKTSLKDIEDKYVEYMAKKELLNAGYGCMVTDIIKGDYTYEEDYGYDPPDVNKLLDKYNTKKDRTNFYPWGIYVTAWARHELWENAIIPMSEKYVYADTDSCYVIWDESVTEHFKNVNDKVMKELLYISRVRHIPIDLFCPITIKGIKKPLGFWEEDILEDFKTLGAKRYATCNEKGFNITVAGLKKSANNYINKMGGFDFFNDNMKIPKEHSGRNIATYIDDKRSGTVIDYLGEKYKYDIRCGVNIEQAEYRIGGEIYNFIDFIKSVDFEDMRLKYEDI